jgi:hypothetical protein
MLFLSSGRGLKLVFALTAALSMAACSKNPEDASGLGGSLAGQGAGMATPAPGRGGWAEAKAPGPGRGRGAAKPRLAPRRGL